VIIATTLIVFNAPSIPPKCPLFLQSAFPRGHMGVHIGLQSTQKNVPLQKNHHALPVYKREILVVAKGQKEAKENVARILDVPMENAKERKYASKEKLVNGVQKDGIAAVL